MSKKKFTDLIDEMLIENKKASLRILLEEEEEDIFGSLDDESEEGDNEESSGDSEGGSEEGASDSEGDDEESPDDSGSDDSGSESKEEKDTDSITVQQFNQVADNIDKITKTFDKAYSTSQSHNAQIIDFVTNHISDINAEENAANESYGLKQRNSIEYFLNEKIDTEKVVKDIDAIQTIIDKGTDLINQFTVKRDVDIEKYVQGAINAYDHFDSMFSKEQIILNAIEGHFMMTCGDNAAEYFEDFKEQFMAVLNEKYGIEDDSTVIKHNNYHNASGASSVGKS